MITKIVLIPLGLSVMLGGCSTAPTLHTFPKLGFNIIELDGSEMHGVCRSHGGGFHDNGSPKMRTDNIRGCWVKKDATIYLDYFHSSKDLIFHELCHADGTRTRAKCLELYPVSSGYK